MNEWTFRPLWDPRLPFGDYMMGSIGAFVSVFLVDLLITCLLPALRYLYMLLYIVSGLSWAWSDWLYTSINLGSLLVFYPLLCSLGGLNIFTAINVITKNVLWRWLFYLLNPGPNGDDVKFIFQDTIYAVLHIVAAVLLPKTVSIGQLVWHAATNMRISGTLVAAAVVFGIFFWIPSLRWWCSLHFRKTLDRATIWIAEVLDQVMSLIRLYGSVHGTAHKGEYVYQNMPGVGEEVRLLRLHGKQRCRRNFYALSLGQIHCDLITVPLSRAEPFDAISYRWTGEPQYPIIIDDSRLLVRPVVYDMLRHLQLSDQDRLLWIDSVCINQDDLQEKSWQIPMMKKIYTGARKVIAWLGHGKASSGALTFLSDLPRQMSKGQADLREYGLFHRRMGGYDTNWRAVVHLLRLEWFSRMWIIQEVVLPGCIVLFHGRRHEEIPWEALAEAGSFLYDPLVQRCLLDSNYNGVKLPDTTALFGMGSVSMLAELRQEFAKTNGLSLAGLLFHSQLFKAWEPKDKVYAILGLLRPGTQQNIRVDYLQDDRKVLIEAAKSALLEGPMERSMELLELAGIGYSKSLTLPELSMPSWCPEWRTLPLERPVINGAYYRAATHLQAEVENTGGPELIKLRGTVTDRVTAMPARD